VPPLSEECVVEINGPFARTLSPMARLLGHSLAAALGFCGLGLIALLPIAAIKFFLWLGFTELATPLRIVETGLLLADIFLFAVVFLSGLAVFSVEAIAAAKRRIEDAWKERNHDD
jgi:ABC-type uncharacterized transport system permease subunit